ncbi:hypothetical protein BDC45DRAFT_533849 [Circinella umbellata]|nr:hypothetical protein BDC45DRAFT_533849 [Circinella umbellata]
MLTKDDRNFYCFAHKMFEIVERHHGLFDDQKKKDLIENDSMSFNNAQFLYRGESVLRSEGDDNYYKVDLRVNFKTKEKKYDLSLNLLRSDYPELLFEGNTMISNLKTCHLKPELALLQGAGNEADILMMKAIDENFTVASRPTKALCISDNLASEKLIFLYNCFLQYKRVTIDIMNLVVATIDESYLNSFEWFITQKVVFLNGNRRMTLLRFVDSKTFGATLKEKVRG